MVLSSFAIGQRMNLKKNSITIENQLTVEEWLIDDETTTRRRAAAQDATKETKLVGSQSRFTLMPSKLMERERERERERPGPAVFGEAAVDDERPARRRRLDAVAVAVVSRMHFR